MRETCKVSVIFFLSCNAIGLHFPLIFFLGSYLNIFCYQIAREVLDAAARVIRPGVTTDEIDRVVHEATIAAGLCLLGFTVYLNLLVFLILLGSPSLKFITPTL